jgi:acyl carrier protein
MEEQLVTIWGDVLKLSKIGVQDNFFDAGGDSLSATRIVTQIREVFQVELPIVTMFDNPTIATLVEQIEQLKATSEPADTSPAVSGKRKKGRL